MQATGSGTLDLVRARILDPTELGVRLSGTTTTTLDDISVSGTVPVAVAVVGQVNVRITGGSVSTSGDAGVVFGEQASGSASGLVCGDKPVVLGEQTSVQLVDSPSCEVTRG